MNIFDKLAFRNLKANKNRTLITVVGIILATAMISGLTTLISSFQDYFYRDAVSNIGSWHLVYESTDSPEMKSVLEDDAIQNVVVIEQKGYAEFSNKNNYKPYLFVISLQDNDLTEEKNREIFPISLIEGRLPQNENEIILPESLLARTDQVYQIGDEVDLDLGYRYFKDSNSEQDLPQNSLFQNSPLQEDESGILEEIRDAKKQSYTITGFYAHSHLEPYSAPGYMAITTNNPSAAKNPDAENNVNQYYIELKNHKDVKDFLERHQIEVNAHYNSDTLRFLGFSLNDGFTNMIYGLGSIFYILIIVASIILISNAFNISLAERIKQFGLLSSVGASQKQLRKTIYVEALMICLLGLPLGILSGIGGIYITLHFVENIFTNIFRYNSMVRLNLNVSWPAILFAIVLMIITVLISAYIPAKKVSKITAIEAIRQNKSQNTKPIKVGKATQKLFGLSGFLATKYYKQSKAKYRSTVISLALSIILFVSAATFTSEITDSVQMVYGQTSTDIEYTIDADPSKPNVDTAKITANINKMTGVEQVNPIYRMTSIFKVKQDSLNKELLNFYAEYPGYGPEKITEDTYLNYIQLCFLEEDQFENLLQNAGLNQAEYEELSKIGYYPILLNKMQTYLGSGRFKEVQIFKNNQMITMLQVKTLPEYTFSYFDIDDMQNIKIVYRNQEDQDKKVDFEDGILAEKDIQINYFIDALPDSLMQLSGQNILFFPMSLKTELTCIVHENSTSFLIDTNEENHYTAANAISDYNSDNNLHGYFMDYYDVQQRDLNVVKIMKIFTYGFIVLISLIALVNVLNTITTNINLRSIDFAMLRSVGLSNQDFKKMTLFECMLYGSKSILYGLPLALLFSCFIQQSVNKMFESAFKVPWSAIGIAIVVIFVFVYITMLFSMRRVRKTNIIESLKRDLQ